MTHALAWVGWVAAILIILSTTRNPWYLGAVLACLVVVRSASRAGADSVGPGPISLGRFGLLVVSFSAVFNALTVHFGDTRLFALPEAIPFFGGLVTLEALVYGALNGLALTGLVAAFVVFNQAVSPRELVRLVPRAFYPIAIITSIALTFVPVTLRHYQAIREAQAVRGHHLRGLRDWLPLLMPLLIGGLERAFQLAEAMTARGFAGSQTESPARFKLLILGGLLLVLAGWLLRLVWGLAITGLLMLALGLGLVIVTLWLEGRRVPRTRYRPQAWQGQDWAVVGGAVMAAWLFAVPWPGLDRSSIFYYPYPRLSWPGYDWLPGLLLLGLLSPALPALRKLGLAASRSLARPEGEPPRTVEAGTDYDSL